MQRLRRHPIYRVKLEFNEDHDNLEDLRGEISTCIVEDATMFLAYDESSAIERLRYDDGAWTKHKSYNLADFFELPEGGDGEMDIEGLAWEEPWLYFSGSMSLKRDTPEEDEDDEDGLKRLSTISVDQNRFNLGRIPCKFNEKKGKWTPKKKIERDGETYQAKLLEGGVDSTVLTEILRSDEHIGRFMEIPCKDNGFDVEGLAVQDGRVYLGLRGPVIGGWAIVIEVGIHEHGDYLHLDGRGAADKPYRKHFLNLAGMGVREINFDHESGDLFLLAGPTMDLDGTISTWRIKGGLKPDDDNDTVYHNPERLYDVTQGSEVDYGHDKAEGLAILEDGNHLIVFDSPMEERFEGDAAVWVDVYHPQVHPR